MGQGGPIADRPDRLGRCMGAATRGPRRSALTMHDEVDRGRGTRIRGFGARRLCAHAGPVRSVVAS
jgi:hypothetical protein